MSETQFFSSVLKALEQQGFRPFSSDVAPASKALTLHDAIRFVLTGLPASSHLPDVAFWEWRDIRRFLRNVWMNLDTALRNLDEHERSVVAWLSESSRGLGDARRVLEGASELPLMSMPIATRRVSPRGLVQSAKVASAIVEALAVLHENSGSTYGDLIEGTLDGFDEVVGDLDLLTRVDNLCLAEKVNRERTDNSTLIPRQLLRTYLKEEKLADEQGDFLSFAGFLQATIVVNNLAGLSDRALLKRLVVIEPEKPGSAYAKAILKVLGG